MKSILSNKFVLMGGVAAVALIVVVGSRGAGAGAGQANSQFNTFANATVADNRAAYGYLATLSTNAARVAVAKLASDTTIATGTLATASNIAAQATSLRIAQVQSAAGIVINKQNTETSLAIEKVRSNTAIQIAPGQEATSIAIANIYANARIQTIQAQTSVAAAANSDAYNLGLIQMLPGAIKSGASAISAVLSLFGQGGAGSVADYGSSAIASGMSIGSSLGGDLVGGVEDFIGSLGSFF